MLSARLLALFLLFALSPQDDIADIKSEKRKAGGDKSKSYFLIGPKKAAKLTRKILKQYPPK